MASARTLLRLAERCAGGKPPAAERVFARDVCPPALPTIVLEFGPYTSETGADLVLALGYPRCVPWSLFAECESEADAAWLGQSLIDSWEDDPLRGQAARLLACELRRYPASGSASAGYRWLTNTFVERTVKELQNAPVAHGALPEERVPSALALAAISDLQHLPASPRPFSIRRWLRHRRSQDSVLLLGCGNDDQNRLAKLWLDIALRTLLIGEVADFELIFDEDALGRILDAERGFSRDAITTAFTHHIEELNSGLV